MKLSTHFVYFKLKHYFIISLTFLFVFGFSITFLPINSSKIVLLFLVSMFILQVASNKQPSLKINRVVVYMASFLSIMFAISLLYVLAHQTMDFSIPYAYFIFLVEALLGSYLLYSLFLKNYSFEEILHILIVVSLLQALIIIGMFTLEPFRDFIFAIAGSKDDLMERYGGFRGFGLAGSVTYDLAVFLSIGMIFITYLVSQSPKNRIFYLVSWVVIFVAVLMTGRTGWIGAFLSILILFINIKNKNSLKSLIYIVFSIILVVLSILNILYYYFPEVYETLFVSVVPYAFEMFINLYETGSMSTRSSNHLQTMYFDVAEKTYLLGDGYWANPNGFGYYMGTDAGYMRHMLFYGIFPSLFLYMFYLFAFFKMSYSVKHTFNNLLLFTMLCGYYFLTHYKGDFLTGSSMNIKLFSILLVYLVVSKNKLIKNGAEFVLMSGSGSAIFAIFNEKPETVDFNEPIVKLLTIS